MIDFPASWNLSVHLAALCFESADDVLALFPASWAAAKNRVSDAVFESLFEVFTKRQSDLAAFAAAGDPAFAEGETLDVHGKGYDVARVDGEGDASLRKRMLDPTQRLTPAAIMSAVKEIIEPFTDKDPWYCELPDDGAFIFHDSGADTTANRRGVYIGDVPRPVVSTKRRYDARLYSTPNAWFLWGSKAASTTRVAANCHGKMLIGIPAIFPYKTSRSSSDFIVSTDGASTPPVFTQAYLSAGTQSSITLTASTKDARLVIGKIKALIANAQAFPYKTSIYLDPLL